MEALADSLGIRARVNFLGQRRDVDRLLAGSQISVLASNWEGFPLSILEAMRAGLPVVASTVGGVAEAVLDQETGYVVPRGDVEVFRDRIKALLESQPLRLRLGANARRRYEQLFTLNRLVSRTLDVYRDVLAGTKGRAPVDRARPKAPSPVAEPTAHDLQARG
jgi:glycosyltransferase involved in cell wall biosynthesis